MLPEIRPEQREPTITNGDTSAEQVHRAALDVSNRRSGE